MEVVGASDRPGGRRRFGRQRGDQSLLNGPSDGSPRSLSPRLRRVAFIGATACIALASVVALARFDGLHATDTATGDSTRWFVDQSTRRLALIDGYSGTTLARLHPGTNKQRFDVIDGPAGAFVLYRRSSEARLVNDSTLELGDATPIPELTSTHQLTAVTRRGLTVIDADTGNGTLFDTTGVVTPFTSPLLDQPMIAPNGALWGLDGTELVRIDGTNTERIELGTDAVELSLVGDEIVVLDRDQQRVRFGDGDWTVLPTVALDVVASELVLQEPGPADDCGWVAALDAMFCVGRGGVERTVGLETWISGSDRLAISGNAGVIVQLGPSNIIQFNPTTGKIITSAKADVPPNANLSINATDGLIWIDHVGGQLIWAANQWTLQSARKDDERAPLLGAEGETIETADPTGIPTNSGESDQQIRPLPDNNGIDDPPVAVPDAALVRSGAALPLVVTANDYDPDGEAVVVQSATAPAHGSTTIASASTISYQAEPGFIGTDTFEYTIADGDGDTDTATVTIEVVGPDHRNQPPVAQNDWGETVAGVPVVIDVLANDYDPERDALQLKSQRSKEGTLRSVVGPSGQPAIEFTPPAVDSETTFTFSYTAQDAYGAVSNPEGTVTVAVRPAGAENLPPVLEADSVRAPVLTSVSVPVLANDYDPDGDDLTLTDLQAPSTLNVSVEGDIVTVSAKEAARDLESFSYTADDGHGHEVTSTVLVLVEPSASSNRPPVAVPDVYTAVSGQRTRLFPVNNDFDPDGDPLSVVDVGGFESDDVPGASVSLVDGGVVLSVPAWASDSSGTGRFEYTISDGRDHTATAVVTVTILPEALSAAPIAVDDHETTERNTPVTLDVLLNDTEPSGQDQSVVGDPTCPEGGTAATEGPGTVRFTPPEDTIGVFRCIYRVSNPQGLTSSARIIITVVDEPFANRPPEPTPDRADALAGQEILIKPLDNDTDPDKDTLVLEAVEEPAVGSARREGNSVIFTAPTQPGVVTFAYQVSDNNGGVSRGQISVKVRAKIDPPEALDDSGSVNNASGGSFSMAVLANDSPAGSLTLTSATKTSGSGSVQVSGQQLVFSFSAGDEGTIVATYTVAASDGRTASATATLTLVKPNRAPVANDVRATVNPGTRTTIKVDVSDPDGDVYSVTLLDGIQPEKNGVTATVVGSREVALEIGANADDASFGYEVQDAAGNTARATIHVLVSDPGGSGSGGSSPGPGPGPGPGPSDPTPPTSTTTPPPPTTPPDCDSTAFAPNNDVQGIPGKKIDALAGVRDQLVGDITERVVVKKGVFDVDGKFTADADFTKDVTFTYTVKDKCGSTAEGQITVVGNRPPQVNNIDVVVNGETAVRLETFATDDGPLTIKDVVESTSTGARAWLNDSKTKVIIDGNTIPKGGRAVFVVTVVDELGVSGKAELRAIRSGTPAPGPDVLNKQIVMTELTRTVQLSRPGWDLVVVDPPQAANGASVNVSGSPEEGTATITLSDVTGVVTASFEYVLKNEEDEQLRGVVSITYDPAAPPSTTTQPPATKPPPTSVPPTSAPTTAAPTSSSSTTSSPTTSSSTTSSSTTSSSTTSSSTTTTTANTVTATLAPGG